MLMKISHNKHDSHYRCGLMCAKKEVRKQTASLFAMGQDETERCGLERQQQDVRGEIKVECMWEKVFADEKGDWIGLRMGRGRERGNCKSVFLVCLALRGTVSIVMIWWMSLVATMSFPPGKKGKHSASLLFGSVNHFRMYVNSLRFFSLSLACHDEVLMQR